MVTRKDVAARAGVSVATVSNVLNKKGLVQPDTERKVLKAVSELGYVPNETARSLSLGRSNHIGIALNELTNPYHMEVIKGIERYAADYGFHVSICNIEEALHDKTDFLRGRKFDVLVNFMTQSFSSSIFEILQEQDTLLVNFPVKGSFSFHVDSGNAILKSMALLQECGHRKVGYISTIDRRRWKVDIRGRIYEENLSLFGFEKHPEYVVYNDDYSKPSWQVGYERGIELFTRHPEITAVYVSNDVGALGVLRALKDLRMRCPEDVSVIGYDGIRIGRLFTPSLVSIGCDNEAYGTEMARHIVDCVLRKENIPSEEYSFRAEMIEGESVAKCRR